MRNNQLMRILSLCVILLPSFALSWNISAASLLEKIHRGAPSWIEEKIDREPSRAASSDEVTLCLQNLKEIQGIDTTGLVRIRLANGAVASEPLFPLTIEQSVGLGSFLSALELLHSIAEMPELDFILCVAPSFDRPLHLLHAAVPIFAVSKERHNAKVILIPRLWNSERETLFHRLKDEWEKKADIAFWRGSASDGTYGFYNWDFNPRAHLALRFHGSALIDAALVPSPAIEASMERWLNNLSLCSSFVLPEEQSGFKYLLSLDGRASPSSFEWQLFSRSLIFKSDSNRIEWFYDLLEPGIHYLPFHPDGGDLAGKIAWAKSEESAAQAIAENGRNFAEKHLCDEEVFVYLFHLFRRYSSQKKPC